jgi:TPR repeat protein
MVEAVKLTLKHMIAAIFLVSSFVGSVAADSNMAGVSAYDEGDYATALRLLRPLANQGDPRALNHLGMMYEYGRGVERNPIEAVKWFRKGANRENPTSMYNLGKMYEKGIGVPQNDILAHMWFNLSGARDLDKARTARDTIAGRMSREEVAEAQKLAREWKPCRYWLWFIPRGNCTPN